MKTSPDPFWLSEFRQRMKDFGPSAGKEAVAVSIKLKVDSGCFCKSCCPEGHRLLAEHLRLHPEVLKDARMVEHESGPEILTYMNLAGGALAFAAAVITLIVAIIQARAEGARRGDKRGYPFKMIVRRIDNQKEFKEDLLLEIPLEADINAEEIASRLLSYAKANAKNSRRKPAKTKKKGKQVI
jgi:hypothetical protein